MKNCHCAFLLAGLLSCLLIEFPLRAEDAVSAEDSLPRMVAENLSAVRSLEATYNLTIRSSLLGTRYETRQIVADFAGGKYLIRILQFKDPERKTGSGCAIETWDGKQFVQFTSGLMNASWDDLVKMENLLGSATVRSSFSADDPLVASHLNLSESNTLMKEVERLVQAGDYHFTESQKLEMGPYQINLLPDGKPTRITILANTGAGQEPFREIALGAYQEIDGLQIPTAVTVRRGKNREKRSWGETRDAILDPPSIKLNAPVDATAFNLKLPPGTIVQDNIKNVHYTIPDDPEEYSGKNLKNHEAMGLAQMARDKQIWAKSLLGQRGPEVVVEKWLTPAPNLKGKFVLVDLWATWCGPCRKSIPALNEIQEKFGDKLRVVGISYESEETVRAMTIPAIKYSLGIDSRNRVAHAVELKAFPHIVLMDPKGIVRWEGFPLLEGQELTNQVVEEIINKYDIAHGVPDEGREK